MAKWLTLQLREGESAQGRVLSAETVREMHALQFAVPVRSRPKDNIYAAQFYGAGLGWFVQDYRGRKIVLHSGAWGAIAAMMPEENLGVVVLSNLDLESLPALLMYDVFDAYLVGPELTWNPSKWTSNWLRNQPPGYAYRARNVAKALLDKTRGPATNPSRPLEDYVGTYESKLYGPVIIRDDSNRLALSLAEQATPMEHWQHDSFYVRAPTRLNFDWLVTFQLSGDSPTSLTVRHVGWDDGEPDQLFVRQP
jgi:hypothetical protein